MTDITDKIAALGPKPTPPGPYSGGHQSWILYQRARVEHAEAERDLALEVLAVLMSKVKWIDDDVLPALLAARAFLAACGKGDTYV